jgi:hypothetical protein
VAGIRRLPHSVKHAGAVEFHLPREFRFLERCLRARRMESVMKSTAGRAGLELESARKMPGLIAARRRGIIPAVSVVSEVME